MYDDNIRECFFEDLDCNGIADGTELYYWKNRLTVIHPSWTAGQILNMSVNYTKNPDVDGDNITDGKEINGYDVKIITGWKSDGTPISEMVNITPDEMDPLIPYGYTETVTKNREKVNITVYTDSDEDGIPEFTGILRRWMK